MLFLKAYASFEPTVVRTLPLCVGDAPFVIEWDDSAMIHVEWSSCVYILVCHLICQKPVLTACAALPVWNAGISHEAPLVDNSTGVIKGALAYVFEELPALPTSEPLDIRRKTQMAAAGGAVPSDVASAIDDEMRMKSRPHFSYGDLLDFVKEYTERLSWNVPDARAFAAEELSHLPLRSFTSLIGWALPPHLYFRLSPAFYVNEGVFEDFIATAVLHMGSTQSELTDSIFRVTSGTSSDSYDMYLILNVMILACSYPSLMAKYATDYAKIVQNGRATVIDTERFTVLAAAIFVGDCEELAKYIAFMFESARSSDRHVRTPLFLALRPIMRLYIAGGALMTATLPSMDAAKRASTVVRLDNTENVTGHMSSLFVQRWRIFSDATGIVDPDPPEFELRTVYPGFGEGTGDLDADMNPLGAQDADIYASQCEAFAGSALERWDRRLPNTARELNNDISVNNFYRYILLFLPCSRQPIDCTFFMPMITMEDGTQLIGCTIPDLLSNGVAFLPAHHLTPEDAMLTQIVLNHLPGETAPEPAALDDFYVGQLEEFADIANRAGLERLDVESAVSDGFSRVVLHKILSDISAGGFADSMHSVARLGVTRVAFRHLVLTPTRALLLFIFDMKNPDFEK